MTACNGNWKLYKAKLKTSVFAGENANKYTVWIAERSALSENPVLEKFLKLGVVNLQKLRHPNILTVHSPLEETSSRLLFVSDRLVQSLHIFSLQKDENYRAV